MTKAEQNRVLAWRLKVLREASAAPRNVAQIRVPTTRRSYCQFCATTIGSRELKRNPATA